MPEHCSDWWGWVEPCLELMAPLLDGGKEEYLDNLHCDATAGKCDVWMIAYPPKDSEPIDIRGFALTYTAAEDVSGAKNLLLYALSIFPGKVMTKELLLQLDRVLTRVAIERGQHEIVFHVHTERMRDYIRSLNAPGYSESTIFRKEV